MRPAGRYAVRNWGTGMQSQRRHDEHDEQDEHDEHDEQDRNRRCDCTFPSLLPCAFPALASSRRLLLRRLCRHLKSTYLTPWSERSGDFRMGLRPSVWLKILKPSRGLALSLFSVCFSFAVFASPLSPSLLPCVPLCVSPPRRLCRLQKSPYLTPWSERSGDRVRVAQIIILRSLRLSAGLILLSLPSSVWLLLRRLCRLQKSPYLTPWAER